MFSIFFLPMHFCILGTTVNVYVKKMLKSIFVCLLLQKNTVRGYTYDAGYTYGAHCIKVGLVILGGS